MSGTQPLSATAQLEQAKTGFRVAQAAYDTLKAQLARGELMYRREFEDRAFAYLRSIRDRLLNMSARHAAVIAAEHNADPIEVAKWFDDWTYSIVDEVAEKWAHNPVYYRALKPDPRLTVSEWADQHRYLSSRGASEAGHYRTARTPYLTEIMDCLSAQSTVQRVVCKKASQLGFTEAGNCWLGYIIDHIPGPVLAVQPTVELAKRFSKQRIEPLIAETPRLRERVAPSRARDSGNTVLMKEFTGGVLVMTGANSAVGLRSMPARFLFLDEVDAYPGDVGDEGDPITLAEARSRTFGYRAKTFLISTPRMKGTSVISREYERSDRRKYFVPCPHCAREQVLRFDQLRYEKLAVRDEATGGERINVDHVHYECEHCGWKIYEHDKTAMLANGRWVPTAQSDDPHMRGYHLSALYSPVGWLSWLTIARQWENEAVKSVDARKGFINTILGEEWEEEANPVPDWQRLYDRRETWAHRTIPERGLVLTAGADVQADRIEVDVWAWGRGLESWLVEHIELPGDPGHAAVWQALTELLGRTWEHESGNDVGLKRLAIDTGAFTQNVYQWARGQDRSVVLPVKGVPAYDRIIPVAGPTRVEMTQGGRKLKTGLAIWTVSVSFFKREFYKHLELARPTDEQRAAGERHPAGYVHIPTAASDEWVHQCVAEQPVIVRSRHGFAVRTEWRPLRNRNEALDMRVYARAAAWHEGIDRWSERAWRSLEDHLGVSPPPPLPASDDPLRRTPPPSPSAPSSVARRPRRQGYSRW